MRNLLKYYRDLDRNTLFVIGAQFFIQLINVSFLSILLIYMSKEGYEDYESADFFSYRFLGVLLFALPIGILIRHYRLKPFFVASSLIVPLISLVLIYAVHSHQSALLYCSTFLWGLFFSVMQVSVLPYILRNTRPEIHTEAFALSFSTWSLSGILGGSLIHLLHKLDPDFFTERTLLMIISAMGLLSLFFSLRINRDNGPEESTPKTFRFNQYDWGVIAKAMFPTLIIASGAGLTIQFMSLFFFNIHGMDSYPFALLNAVALVIVFFSIIVVPTIKRKLGYKIAITATQTIAVMALVVLATTEFYSTLNIALYIAFAAYLIRQPLMNMANPMASELVMKYVGKKNQEIISALTSATWSGSWFISARIFKVMREHEVRYAHIFLITAGLYALGVFMYHRLIVDYERRDV
ncbi:MAG: MFS transporter [Flavobacteriales bacterium]|nr:MFS transporter [Flavobacteriales bacterium]